MTIPYLAFPSPKIIERDFDVEVIYKERETYLVMRSKKYLHTASLPATIPVLKKKLPSIFYSQCFNYSNFTFKEEVRDTEVAHLFEHIVLEYLCRIKSTEGGDNVQFQGETKWNWAVDPKGTFHISISSGLNLSHAFKKALEKAIELINKIIEESESNAKSQPVYAPVPTSR